MRFPKILLAVYVACHTACSRAPDTPVVAADPELAAAEPVSGWPDTNRVSRAGRVFFAGQPSEAALRLVAREGIVLVINLLPAEWMADVPFDEAAMVESLGMRYEVIPMDPPRITPEGVDRFAEVLATTDGSVLLHCKTSNLVGGVWAAYLARERGVGWAEALGLGRAAGLYKPPTIESARQAAERS
jgi:uncharacterized protein (TIGR01244 family)